jgi:ComF family protein
MSPPNAALSLLEGFLAVLAPPLCAGCDLGLAASVGHVFCEACEPLLEPSPAHLLPPARSAAVWRYQGPLADAIRRFKYGGASELAVPLGSMLALAAATYTGTVDAVVPVPLHPRKLRERGYNPAALLGRPVARALGIPQRTSWLTRARATRSQAGLSREARQSNVRAAFLAKRRAPARLLLIDDVRTTGATLSEAARVLTAHGHEVVCLALAFAAD